MVFEMSIQDFDDRTHDHMYPHQNGGVDYREGSFISDEVKGYQESGVYHSDSQVGTVFIRISVPELKLQKCLQFELDETVWQAKQRILGSFAKDLKDSINYGLYCPPMNGRAGKFLDEERLLREYPLQGPIGFLEFKYKKRVYKMMHVNVRKLKQLHVKSNLRHFIDYVRTCNIEKLNKMSNKGLDPNFHDSSTGETPLCLAASMNKPKCRELIICLAGGGAHLDFRNKKGMTALHVAVIAGNTEAIKTLLDLGVSPNIKDSRSLTPLYYTVCHCSTPGCMEMLLQERAFIGSQDEQGWFEIHHACRQGLVQHLEHLLFYGADMDVQNASGNTALHVCALHNRESCLRVLLFRGANKEILNYSNQSPYESAILAGNDAIAEIIEGHKNDDVVPFRETPRFSTRRRDSVASAAMYALYRSRSDPRINQILISPSSSTQSFSHLHNSLTTDSYSGSRGTDSPCSMSLSSSSSGPGFFGKGASASFPLRRPISVCQSHFPEHNKSSFQSQFEIIKKRLTPANSFRSLQSRDRLDIEFHKDLQRRLSLQFELRKRTQYFQNLTVPRSHMTRSRSSDQGSDSSSTILSPSMESIDSVRSQSPRLSTFSSHSGNVYSSSQSVEDSRNCARDHYKSQNTVPVRNSVCTSDCAIYSVISKPKKHRMPMKIQGRGNVCKQEEIYSNPRISSEFQDKCKSLPSKDQVSRQRSAPAGDIYSFISANHCPPEAKLELETDHIFVCIERYVPRTPDELALEKGDIVEVLGVGEQGFWEGRVNGNEGMFPSNYVHEVKLRRKAGSLGDLVSASRHDMMLNRNTLAAIVPNFSEYAPRSVVLQKGPEGYGFVLRGAKSQTQATGELDFRPSAEFPALQYLDSVDPGSRADRAGLKTGDFILEINGENVVRASHDRVVQLIRQSGDTLALKVVTVKPLEKPDHWLQHHNGTMTLPNRGGARRQAPQPPQRDPQTSLSVGKAQGKQFTEGMAELDQLDIALAEYERQTVQSVVSSDQKTASIRSKHSAKRVSCIELDKIENPDSKAATTKGKMKDYMSPSEIRIQKYHHKKAGGNLERSSSTPSLVDKKNEAVYATPTVPSTEQNDIGHRRSSSGAAVSHIYATPGERPKAPPPPPPSGSSTPSPKRPAPAPPESPHSEIISISTDRRKSSLSSVTDSLLSTEKPASEYESSFRPGISAQLTTEPKMSTPSLQQAKLRSHNRNSSQVSVNSNDSGGSKRSDEKLGVTFADDKVQDHANLFLQKHPNAQLLVTADVHAKNKDRKMSEPEPDYDSDENDDKVKNKVTVISVGGGSEGSKKYTVKSDIPSGGGGMVIPPPPSEPAPKPPSHKPPSPLPKPAKQDTEIKVSFSTENKVIENFVKNNETSAVKSEETVTFSSKTPEPEPLNAPPAPPAPPPPPPAPPAPGVSAPVEKPKTPPPVSEKKPKPAVQGIPSKDIMAAVAQRKTRIESEGMKISTGPNKEAPVKDGKDLRNRMIDNTHSAILAAVAKRRALLEEKESDHSVAEEIENRLQKTKKLQSAKYFFSSESIQKKEAEKTNKVETKTETSAKDITPTIVKPTTPTSVSSKTTKPPSPVPSKKTKPPSPSPARKISPPTPGAKTLPSATKTTAAPSTTKTVEKTQNAPKPIYSSSAKPPSPKLKKAPSPVPIKSPVTETTPDKPKAKAPATPTSPKKEKEEMEKDENEDLLAKAEKARQDYLQKKSSSTSLKSPRDVTRNPSKLNSPRRTASKAGTKTESSETKKESSSSTKITPKTNGMTLPLKNEESNGKSVPKNQANTAKSPVQIQSTKSQNRSGITPMKTSKDSDVLMKTKNIKDRIANFEKDKPLVNGKSDGNSKIPVHGVTVDSSLTDKSPALPPPPEFGDALQLEIIPPPSGFNVNDTLESPTYTSAFHHSDSSSVSTLSTLSDDHIDTKTKHFYEDLIAPPPPGFDDNSEDTVPSVIPPPPDFGGNKPAQKSNKTVNKPFLSKPISNWQCLDVLDWLDSIEMAQYKKSFQQHCIDGKKLNGLQRNDYIQLGVTQVGHRMMMERAIKKASNIVTGTHL